MSKPLALVLATYNRAKRLDLLLTALQQQTLSHDWWELLVCVDGSTDHSVEVLRKHESEAKIPMRWFVQENTGQAGARHRAILASDARCIVVIDDDMELAPDFLAAHLAESDKNPETAVVIGKVIPLPEWQRRPLFEAVREDFMLRLHTHLEVQRPVPPTSTSFVTQNVSFPRALYLAVGGFDASLRLAEDTELGIKLERSGAAFVFSTEAWAIHRSDVGGYATWARRELAYGRYFVQIWQTYNKDPLLHPLRNYLRGSVLNRWMVNLTLPIPGGRRFAEFTLRVVGEVFRLLHLWGLAIATHKAISAILRHQGVMEAMGSWRAFLRSARELDADPRCPDKPTFSGRMVNPK